MTAVSCPRCGNELAVPEPTVSTTVSFACPACEARLEVSVVEGGDTQTRLRPDGVESALEPAEQLADPSATVPLGSGTSILKGKLPTTGERPVETVLQASLVVLGADPGTKRFVLGSKVTTVGREAADIVIADDAISSRHCEIEARGEKFYLHDLDSSNGTLVNDEPVRSVQLASGDTIRIGKTVLAFKVVEAIALEGDD